MTLEEGGAARVEDRVSPCPPDVACVWSGVVHHSGRWQRTDAGVTLALEAEGKARKAAQLGSELQLRWDGQPVERDGEETCRYRRASDPAAP